jgi:hypothetical protein
MELVASYPTMSIKLRLEKGSIVMQAFLEDEAFTELLAIIQKHESKAGAAAPTPTSVTDAYLQALKSTPEDITEDPTQATKAWLAKHSASEVLNMIRWDKNPDKILLLAAHYEAKGGAEGWRSADMETKFSEAKEGFPGNFSRDIVTAIKDGMVATVTPRTYKVSRTGWNRIGEAFSKLPPV